MRQSMGSEWARRALISFVVAVAEIPLIPGPRADTGSNPPSWSPQEQQAFYTADQGSRIIPILWFLALNKADGSALFAADGLARYGYLANPKSAVNPWGLPVGFMVANDIAAYGGRPTLAMNCNRRFLWLPERSRRGGGGGRRRRGLRRLRPSRVRREIQRRCRGGAASGSRSLVRRIRLLHEGCPARPILGAYTPRRIRHDLQPRQRARSRSAPKHP